jgi:uncharacterized repeat protein (TIGR03803 family)
MFFVSSQKPKGNDDDAGGWKILAIKRRFVMKTKHGWLQCGLLVAALGWCVGIQPAIAQYTLLHTFTGSEIGYSGMSVVYDGATPYGSLTLSADGSTLYGMTSSDGNSSDGTQFKMNCDGSGFALCSFMRNGGSGATPYGSLMLAGSTLYGMTSEGGYWLGVVFWNDITNFVTPTNRSTGGGYTPVGTGGGGSGILHCFEWSGSGDGATPDGSLTLVGSTLYGMTSAGGSSSDGTLFTINTDGNSYAILHNFAGGSSDGATPYGSLAWAGSELYGMTYAGGNNGDGTLFKININGSGFTILHHFGSGNTDGTDPMGSLTLSGSTLYGMTTYGGSSGFGTVFKINTADTGYTILHNFTGGSEDGQYPHGDLTLSADGSTLYGMTSAGGSSGLGVVFKMNINGTGYTILHNFTGGSNDGATPYGSMTFSSDGSTLYGMTSAGGSNDLGVVFALPLNTTAAVTPAMISPAPGSTLTSSSVVFQWSSGTGVTNYFLYVGSSAGDNDIYGKSAGLNLSTTVNNLPVNGSTLYVRLWWATPAAGWQYTDYTYTAFKQITQTKYLVAVSASPSADGTVSGGGTFAAGSSCTVTATAKSGYTFANWTENGGVVSASPSYTFTLNANQTLVANFTKNAANYTITLSASPSAGGTVSGGGTFVAGSSCTVTATAKSGYTFANWTENGGVVSASSSYTFPLNGNQTLVANFTNNTANNTITLHGFWAGTWAWSGPGSNGCQFSDGGSFAMILSQNGTSFSGSTSGAGIQSRNNTTCALASTGSGVGTVSGTISGTTLNLSFNLGSLSFTGTATLNNNTLTGTFVRSTGGNGSFTVTRQ